MVHEQNSAYKGIELLAETSWEVCNKIGGIYTVLSTKARILQEKFGEKLLFIGPDVWSDDNPSPYFREDKSLLKAFVKRKIEDFNISVRTGRWDIPGSPQVILVKFEGVYGHLNDIFSQMWEKFGVNSIHEYGDYREGCAFAVASAVVVSHLADHLCINQKNVVAHFNEWTTGMGLLYLRMIMPCAASLFTTHATSIGRSICGNGKPLYDYFEKYNGDQMAGELNMEAKHSLEKTAALNADCFTAVSDLTAKETKQLLGIEPQIVTPNGFEPDFVPGESRYKSLRKKGREKILAIASRLKNRDFKKDCLIVATSGRNEYRNKGLDLFLDSLKELEKNNPETEIIGLVLVPAWVNYPIKSLIKEKDSYISGEYPDYITHILHNMEYDSVARHIESLEKEQNIGNNVNVIYVPCYLNGNDGIIDISYYDLLPAIDITVFASYYEPWGYTPLESVAFGIPTITTDKSGFGQWILSNMNNSLFETGVIVISRNDSNYCGASLEIAVQLQIYAGLSKQKRKVAKDAAKATALKADWKYFIDFYYDAFNIALKRRDERI